jgi:hypothetical protein
VALTRAQARLRKMVLDSVPSPHTRRNYGKALDDLFQFCASRPLSRSLLMEWRAGMESLSPSTINVRLSAVRKLVGEARCHAALKSRILLRTLAYCTQIADFEACLYSNRGRSAGDWSLNQSLRELFESAAVRRRWSGDGHARLARARLRRPSGSRGIRSDFHNVNPLR